MKLLLIGNDFVVDSWFVAFEEGWATKDKEVSKAGLAMVAELIWSCRNSIDVSDILSWTDINNCGQHRYVHDAIHFLMFGGSSFEV